MAQAVLSATSVGTKLGFAETRAGRRLFVMLAPLLRIPVVQRRLMRAASQLDTSYSSGLLADTRSRGCHGPPRPGRVPNIPTRDAAGKQSPLHTHLGTGWALLTDGEAGGPLREAAQRLGTDVQELTPVTGALREVFLVRPDAHLAWRGARSADLARVEVISRASAWPPAPHHFPRRHVPHSATQGW